MVNIELMVYCGNRSSVCVCVCVSYVLIVSSTAFSMIHCSKTVSWRALTDIEAVSSVGLPDEDEDEDKEGFMATTAALQQRYPLGHNMGVIQRLEPIIFGTNLWTLH